MPYHQSPGSPASPRERPIAVIIKSSSQNSRYIPQHDDDSVDELSATVGSEPLPARRVGRPLKSALPALRPPLPSLHSSSPHETSALPPTQTQKQASTPTPSADQQRKRGRPKGTTVAALTARASKDNLPPPQSRPRRSKAVVRPRDVLPKPGASTQKRRSRPPKLPTISPRKIYNKHNARFAVFKCEWLGCQAELQNLDTLERHVLLVHGERALVTEWGSPESIKEKYGQDVKWGIVQVDVQFGGGKETKFGTIKVRKDTNSLERKLILDWDVNSIPGDAVVGFDPAESDRICIWRGCNMKASPQRFATLDEWEDHMMEEHLIPYSWHSGDGVGNSGLEGPDNDGRNKLPDWLFDKNGKQVTPSTRNQTVEDQATYLKNRKKLRALLQAVNDALPSEEEEDEPIFGA